MRQDSLAPRTCDIPAEEEPERGRTGDDGVGQHDEKGIEVHIEERSEGAGVFSCRQREGTRPDHRDVGREQEVSDVQAD